jgi:hypothetical protein
MRLNAWLALLVGRFWKVFGLYLCALIVLVEIQPRFEPIDGAIAAALAGMRPQPKIDKTVAIVDLDVDAQRVRAAVVDFLAFVSANVANLKMDAPQNIVLDCYFMKREHSDEHAMLNAGATLSIRSLFIRGTKVYASVNPHSANGGYQNAFMKDHDQTIYDALAGSGHTDFGTNRRTYPLVWYPASIAETVTKDHSVSSWIAALPLVAKHDVANSTYNGSTYGFIAGADPPGNLYTLAELRNEPSLLNDHDYVVVGSRRADKPFDNTAGLTLTAWALSDLVSEGKPGHLSIFHDDVLFIALSLLLSIVAALCFVVAFRFARTASWRLTAATAASAIFPACILIAVVLVAALLDVIWAHSVFSLATILTTTLACRAGGRAQVQRDLIVSRFVEGKTEVRRHFDVFISYSRDDENTAWVKDRVVEPLRRARRYDGEAPKVFFDLEKIQSGAAWFEKIVEALWGSRFIIAVYTPRYFERRMCIEELLTAMRRSISDPAFVILPVSRMAQDVPPQFGGMQIVDAQREPHFMDEIIATICRAPVEKTVAGVVLK